MTIDGLAIVGASIGARGQVSDSTTFFVYAETIRRAIYLSVQGGVVFGTKVELSVETSQSSVATIEISFIIALIASSLALIWLCIRLGTRAPQAITRITRLHDIVSRWTDELRSYRRCAKPGLPESIGLFDTDRGMHVGLLGRAQATPWDKKKAIEGRGADAQERLETATSRV